MGRCQVLMSVRSRDGRVTDYTAGVGDIRTKSKVPTDGYVRIAGNTKMFTAVAENCKIGVPRPAGRSDCSRLRVASCGRCVIDCCARRVTVPRAP